MAGQIIYPKLPGYDSYKPKADVIPYDPVNKPKRKRKRKQFIVKDNLVYDVYRNEAGKQAEAILRAVHEIEAITVKYQAKFVDLSADVMTMSLQYRQLCLREYRHHRAVFDLVPSHVLNNLLFSRARLIDSQPIGQRSYPELRPLAEVYAHYDNRYMRFERDEELDAWLIRLPTTGRGKPIPLSLRFHQPDNDWASDKMQRELLVHRIASATLKYRGEPKPDRSNNGKQLVVKFDPTQPAYKPYKKSRSRNIEIQRMYYDQGMDTRAIAGVLQVTIRTVQLALRGTEVFGLDDDLLEEGSLRGQGTAKKFG